MSRRRSDDESDGPALGSDPFRSGDSTLPYLTRLRERESRPRPGTAAGPRRGGPGLQVVPGAADPEPAPPPAPPDLGPDVPGIFPTDESDESNGWLDSLAGLLLSKDDEERLSLAQPPGMAGEYDAFGLNSRVARRAFAVFRQIYQRWFGVESRGHAHVPEKQGVILAANHGGLLPFDAAMIVVDMVERGSPPRLVRTVVDRWAGSLPFVNVFYARVGQIIGTRENVRELLADDQAVLVFPEGMPGIHKLAAERYMLREFRVGFVEESLRHRVPIVPVAVVGADDQAPILYDVKPLARMLGLPFFPITPTFPLLGPLGLLPLPVKYEIVYGAPLRFYEDYPPDVIDNPDALQYMAETVRRRVQTMVDERVVVRRGRKR